jgi:hypothetical protein
MFPGAKGGETKHGTQKILLFIKSTYAVVFLKHF